jgi:hypothetical protein
VSPAQRPDPELRIGDAEREAAVAALGEHYTSGRITRDEFDERSTRAFAARTHSELWPLFVDLPPLRPAARPVDRSTPARLDGARRGPRGGWWVAVTAPLFLVLLALMVLADLPWPILLVAGWVWWSLTRRHSCRTWAGQTSGSRRAVRGTCS